MYYVGCQANPERFTNNFYLLVQTPLTRFTASVLFPNELILYAKGVSDPFQHAIQSSPPFFSAHLLSFTCSSVRTICFAWAFTSTHFAIKIIHLKVMSQGSEQRNHCYWTDDIYITGIEGEDTWEKLSETTICNYWKRKSLIRIREAELQR